MALIVLAADKGSPGVTTSAVALAAVWPRRALYAECDPHGGDMVYRMPAEHGGPLDPNRGLVSLALDARRGLDPGSLPQHTQRLRGGLEILVGLGNADQSHGMAGLWPQLGRALDRFGDLPYGADVIADCGRIGPDSPTIELLAQSALVLLITRTEAECIAHVRDRANSLSARLHATQAGSVSLARPPIGIVLITPPNRARQAAKQVGDLLAATTAGAEVLGVLAQDEAGAAALAGRARGRVDKALLTRSARELAGTVVHRYGLIVPGAGTPQPGAVPAPPPAAYPAGPGGYPVQPGQAGHQMPPGQPGQPPFAPVHPAPSYEQFPQPAPRSVPQPAPQLVPQSVPQPGRPTPIDPSSVHPAGTVPPPSMPPNLTGVPHPGAYPPPHQGTNGTTVNGTVL